MYVDGFVVPVPRCSLKAYKKLARLAGRVWKEHGALSYVEAIADDVEVGKVTSFPRSVKLKEDEIAIFSWITYRNRRSRDSVLKKVMADPRLSRTDMKNAPFDAKRMIYGGFRPFLEL